MNTLAHLCGLIAIIYFTQRMFDQDEQVLGWMMVVLLLWATGATLIASIEDWKFPWGRDD